MHNTIEEILEKIKSHDNIRINKAEDKAEDKAEYLKIEVESEEYQRKLNDFDIKDKNFIIDTRKQLKTFFLYLLTLQNIAIFVLIYISYHYGYGALSGQSFSFIISVLVSGTIIETAMVLKVMVDRIFSPIEYHNFKNFKNSNSNKK